MEPSLQAIAENIVRNDVYLCATYIVHKMYPTSKAIERLLKTTKNYQPTQITSIYQLRENNPERNYDYEFRKFGGSVPLHSSGAVGHYNHEDVYEYWFISDWLADKLEDKGEIVLHEFADFYSVWGRSTTGQAISMDSVIEDIAKGLTDE